MNYIFHLKLFWSFLIFKIYIVNDFFDFNMSAVFAAVFECLMFCILCE